MGSRHAIYSALAIILMTSAGCARYIDWVFCSNCGDGGAPDAEQQQGVVVLSGSFNMGSPAAESCREPWSSRETEHQVSLTRGFRLAATEVTQAEFSARMGYAPSAQRDCAECPVENVSWHEAAAYCNALSDEAQLERCYACQGSGATVSCAVAAANQNVAACTGYRLPAEAEWEYAARAGSTTATPRGDLSFCDEDPLLDPLGWYLANSNRPRPVAQKSANDWGIFDMAGNVWEWCNDWHTDDLGAAPVSDPSGQANGTHRVVRGGSFEDDAGELRSAMRDSTPPDQRHPYIGFRWARSAP